MPPRLKKNDTPVRREEEAQILRNKDKAYKQRIKNKESMQASKDYATKAQMNNGKVLKAKGKGTLMNKLTPKSKGKV